jgi:hypothetical protein
VCTTRTAHSHPASHSSSNSVPFATDFPQPRSAYQKLVRVRADRLVIKLQGVQTGLRHAPGEKVWPAAPNNHVREPVENIDPYERYQAPEWVSKLVTLQEYFVLKNTITQQQAGLGSHSFEQRSTGQGIEHIPERQECCCL